MVHKGKFAGANNPFYGKKHPQEIMQKILESRSWYKGSEQAKLAGIKISKANKGRPKPPRTPEHCLHMSQAKKGKPSWNKGISPKPESVAKWRKTMQERGRFEQMKFNRLAQKFPQVDNKLEKQFQLLLAINGIKFETHVMLSGQPDIFIEPDLCIFIDGCYWHCCQKCNRSVKPILEQIQQIVRDLTVTHELSAQGYKVMRFWEHEIKSSKPEISQNIIKNIKEGMKKIG